MEESNEERVTRLPAERIPPGLPARVWVNRKDKKTRWIIENGRWVKKNENNS
jgi:hypothetical protein